MMRTARSRRRRDEEESDEGDGLLAAVVRGVFDGARGALEKGARRVIRWSAARLVFGVVTAVVWSAAVVLLLSAAVEALKELSVPSSLAYLGVALLAAAGGWACWRAAVRGRPDPD